MNFTGKFIISELRGTIDIRDYVSKTLQLQFVLKTPYKEYRIGL